MSLIIALILSLSTLFATSAQPASAAQTATIEAPIEASVDASLPTYLTEVATSEAPIRCEEDMPCWDCATMGNKQCGPIAQPAQPAIICEEDMPCWDCATMGNKQCGVDPTMEQDAYVSYDSQLGQPANETELMLSYVATVPVEPVTLAANQFYLPSSNIAGVWHIMQWDSINHA